MTRLLVVDDDRSFRDLLGANLRARGYDADVAADGRAALELAAARRPDGILLDLQLPDLEGLVVLTRLRAWTNAPILIVSASGSEAVKVDALERGADDFLTKPVSMGELIARLRAALRRFEPGTDDERVGTLDFVLDLRNRVVTRTDGTRCRLTASEWRIVEALVRRPDQPVSYQALQRLANPDTEAGTGLVRVHLRHIRAKLEPDPHRPRYFLNAPRTGYRFHISTASDRTTWP